MELKKNPEAVARSAIESARISATVEQMRSEGKTEKEIAAKFFDNEDDVVELTKSMAILPKNDAAKRDLVEMIHVGATGVEFISYLYANAVYFYKALESLSNAVLVVGKR